MKLTADQIAQNWDELLNIIKTEFTGDRKAKLLAMYTDLEDRMAMAPASSFNHYHNAFPGGYVDHVLRVIKCAQEVHALWTRMEGDMSGYTREELMFTALNHDIGKMGFPGEGNEIYQRNDSEWHRKNQGKEYKINPNNPFTLVNDLSLWLLGHYGISVTWNEMLGIKLTDGLYDETNKAYFISRNADSKLKTNLGYVMHQADSMAARIEYEHWNNNKPITANAPKKKITSPQTQINANKMFNELFGD